MERANQTIKGRLIKSVQDQKWKSALGDIKEFSRLLDRVIDDYNHSKHHATNEIPYEVINSLHPDLTNNRFLLAIVSQTIIIQSMTQI